MQIAQTFSVWKNCLTAEDQSLEVNEERISVSFGESQKIESTKRKGRPEEARDTHIIILITEI